MAPPCKTYLQKSLYLAGRYLLLGILLILPSLRPWGVAARPAILENRGGKSHFCDYFIIRARYVYLSNYKKCRACNSLHFLLFMFFCQINSFVVTASINREFLLFLYFLFFSHHHRGRATGCIFLRSVPGGHSPRCSRSLLFYSF
jgi:hypothetical protein